MWTIHYRKHLKAPPVERIGVSYPQGNSLYEKQLTALTQVPTSAERWAFA